MPRISSTIAKIRHAALLAALTAPLACGASAGEDDTVSAALPVQAAAAPTPCTTTTVVDGSVVIATPADAVAYRCVSVIRGDLSVLSSAGTLYGDIDLSNLEAVHGDVLLAYAPRIDNPSVLREIHLGKLAAIVRNPTVATAEARGEPASAVAAPNVAKPPPPPPRAPYVHGGRLLISIDFGPTMTGDVAFALQSLSRVDADLSIEMKGNNEHSMVEKLRVTSGLERLETVHGNLLLTVSNNRSYGLPNQTVAEFLSHLTNVDGSVTFRASSPNQLGYTLAMKTIGGDLSVEPLSASLSDGSDRGAFDGVTRVGGAIRITRRNWLVKCSATAASLSVTDSYVNYIDGAPTVGELRIERNYGLYHLPLGGRVVGNGAIVIRDNPGLSQCDVTKFVEGQRALGWTGIATMSGNHPDDWQGHPVPERGRSRVPVRIGAIASKTFRGIPPPTGATNGHGLALPQMAGAAVVGELRVERNPNLGSLPAEARVVGNGAIVIRDNASLSQCDVTAFVAHPRSLGWTGVATTSGNRPDSASGQPCL